jgi:hypothetical protein
VTQFGEKSPAVQSWLQAQTLVFRNCSAGGAGGAVYIPAAAQTDLPALIRADREYQIAAANLYAGKWDDAEKQFLLISNDASSPWRAIAGLVAARCEIRKATLGTDDPADQKTAFAAADAQLTKIIGDPAFDAVKPSALRLRGFVDFRLRPGERASQLSGSLERGDSPTTFSTDLDDFSQLARHQAIELASDDAARGKDPMTDWIISFRFSGDTGAEAHRVVRWQQTHSLAWLVAALADATPQTPKVGVLLDASAKVPVNSPAYLTLAFERDTVLADTGKQAQARQEIDKILTMPNDRVPAASRNIFLALRMKLAQNLEELLRYAPRTVVEVPEAVSLPEDFTTAIAGKPLLDDDAAIVFSRKLPLSVLKAAAQSNLLTPRLRRDVAVAAFTRAVLLRDNVAARELAPAVGELVPSLKKQFATYASVDAADADAQEFAAAFLLLHAPGSRPVVGSGWGSRVSDDGEEDLTAIDDYRDNWWCYLGPTGVVGAADGNPAEPQLDESLRMIYRDGRISAPAFLTAQEREATQREWAAIAALPAGSQWLAERAITWAKAHPDDARVPEALHLAVRATRHGCRGDNTEKFSREAFDLLHQRYPKSDWTAKTPYWFN